MPNDHWLCVYSAARLMIIHFLSRNFLNRRNNSCNLFLLHKELEMHFLVCVRKAFIWKKGLAWWAAFLSLKRLGVFYYLFYFETSDKLKEIKFALRLLILKIKSAVNILLFLCVHFNLSSEVIKTLISQISFKSLSSGQTAIKNKQDFFCFFNNHSKWHV